MKTMMILFAILLTCTSLHAEDSLLTPLTIKVLAAPVPVKGSDGAYHVVYELKMTNASSSAWEIESLEILDNKTPAQILGAIQGDALKSKIELLGLRTPTRSLEPSQTAIAWMALSFPTEKDIPEKLMHRLKVSSATRKLTEMGGDIEISHESPSVLQAPLKGGSWIAADGCCNSTRHLRALLPVKGNLVTSQRFAIDWEKIGPENTIYKGDRLKVESYFCYGQEIIAAADGKVVNSFDGLPNQIPGKLPASLDPKDADGNHVIQEIAPGRYALYAHMIPGSLRVKTGDMVKQGQVIGLVGNSGNSSAPHLHFHVMDGTSTLGSNGLPYVLQKFKALGKTPGTAAFDTAELKGTPLAIQEVAGKGLHKDELPMDQWLIDFDTDGK